MALDEISETEWGRTLLEFREEDGRPITFVVNHRQETVVHSSNGDPMDGVIYIDPDYEPEIQTNMGSTNYPLKATVAHELGHLCTGVGDTGFGQMDNVITNEIPITREWGWERSKY